MAEPIRFDKSGFNQAEKIRRQGQTSLVLVNGLGVMGLFGLFLMFCSLRAAEEA